MMRERLLAMLSGFFGLLAAALTSVGLYGLIAYMTARRRHEIGIRMALGASPASVTRLVLREAALLLGGGLVIGIAASLAAMQAAASILFGLKPGDPLTLASAAILLVVVAVVASTIPARRAAALDPMLALRQE
jgi:ABC-type antimicrobial peptide transport system permease subunit